MGTHASHEYANPWSLLHMYSSCPIWLTLWTPQRDTDLAHWHPHIRGSGRTGRRISVRALAKGARWPRVCTSHRLSLRHQRCLQCIVWPQRQWGHSVGNVGQKRRKRQSHWLRLFSGAIQNQNSITSLFGRRYSHDGYCSATISRTPEWQRTRWVWYGRMLRTGYCCGYTGTKPHSHSFPHWHERDDWHDASIGWTSTCNPWGVSRWHHVANASTGQTTTSTIQRRSPIMEDLACWHMGRTDPPASGAWFQLTQKRRWAGASGIPTPALGLSQGKQDSERAKPHPGVEAHCSWCLWLMILDIAWPSLTRRLLKCKVPLPGMQSSMHGESDPVCNLTHVWMESLPRSVRMSWSQEAPTVIPTMDRRIEQTSSTAGNKNVKPGELPKPQLKKLWRWPMYTD